MVLKFIPRVVCAIQVWYIQHFAFHASSQHKVQAICTECAVQVQVCRMKTLEFHSPWPHTIKVICGMVASCSNWKYISTASVEVVVAVTTGHSYGMTKAAVSTGCWVWLCWTCVELVNSGECFELAFSSSRTQLWFGQNEGNSCSSMSMVVDHCFRGTLTD